MTDHDRLATRREIADALTTAFDRRQDVLEAIVEADDRAAAIEAITALLGTSQLGAETVLGISFDKLTKDARRKNAAELEDLNSQLTFTLQDRPASSGDYLVLRPFAADSDSDIFAARTQEIGVAGDGSGQPAASLAEEVRAARKRIDDEEAAWFVAIENTQKVGMVFGELVDGEVDVRIWIHPDHRKKGCGTAALRKSRSMMAAYFPAVPMVVRAPGVNPA